MSAGLGDEGADAEALYWFASGVMRDEVLPEVAQTPPPVDAPQSGEAVEAAATDQELQDPFAQPQAADAAPAEAEVQPAVAEPGTPPAEQAEIDPELRTFVDAGRSKLDAIDDLLQKEGP